MGQSYSIYQSSFQGVENKIAQISNQYCVNLCLTSGQINDITLSGGNVYGSVTINAGCLISGASCILKSSLDDTVINDLSNKQKGSFSEQDGPFGFLESLAEIGSNTDITQQNYQQVTNDITQSMNSTCGQKTDNFNQNNIIDATNENIYGNVTINAIDRITNSKCISTNVAKNYVDNNLSNDQTATIARTSCIAAIISAIISILILGAIIFVAMKTSTNLTSRKKKTNPSPKASPKASPKTSQS